MVNNINKTTATPTPAVDTNKSAAQQPSAENARAQSASVSAPRQDAVSLTPQAQQMSNLTKKAASESGINQEKVDKVKKALADGSYKVDVDRLAAKIAQFEADLFDR